MREIIFRGKIESGVWVYGDLRQYPSGRRAIRSDEWGHMMTVDAESVGQYTGLKDKNGEKIFEGDIVRAVLPQTDAQAGFVWPARAVVFRDGCFGFAERPDITPLHSFAPTVELEIIGNIYDNPELMEVDDAID